MKIEVLKNNRKMVTIIVFIVLTLIAIIYGVSLAKYRSTKVIKLASGTINYKKPDLDLYALYLEDSDGSYKPASGGSIPIKGYVLNTSEGKSGCYVSGVRDESVVITYQKGEVSFSKLTKAGTKCYLYFDRIRDESKPVILSVTESDITTSSFRLTVTASDVDGEGEASAISKYYYRINGGEEKSVTSNIIDITGLSDGTNYTISIVVEDLAGNRSEVATKSVKTISIDRTIPVISDVGQLEITQNSFKVSVSASDKDSEGNNGTVVKYYYSINNGAYVETANNYYVFSSLSAGTNYTIKVMVEDAAGNKSEVMTKTFATKANSITIAGSTSSENGTFLYSTDNGNTWQNLTVGKGVNISLVPGTQLKGKYTSFGSADYIRFCKTSTCTSSTTGSNVLGTASANNIYTITGEEVAYCFWTCFTEETELLGYDEKKKKKLKRKVKDFRVGDKLYTFDEEQNKFVTTKIKKIEKVKTKDVYAIHLDSGDVIRSSEGHAFYVAGVGYMQARELREGTSLMGIDKNYKIDKVEVEHYEEEITLYNLYLDNNKNCFVSGAQVLSYMMTLGVATQIKKIKVVAVATVG